MIAIDQYGDAAVLINFEQKMDPHINNEVVWLADSLEKAKVPGVLYYTPAYCSIVAGYDPALIKFELLRDIILNIYVQEKSKKKKRVKRKKWTIPVCYEPPFSPDMDELEQQLGISKEKIIQLHTRQVYQVYMLGFLPGFPYMGILPKALHCERKKTPRLQVPSGSVGLAGKQTGIYPMEAPGGWQIIGRTPVVVFDEKKENPFFFQPGDLVQFQPLSMQDYFSFSSINSARS